MLCRKLFWILAPLALGTSAQAAEFRLGVHAEGYVGGTYGFGFLPDVGVDASLTQPIGQNLGLRGKFGVGIGGGTTIARIDLALLNRRSLDWYYGAGLGTGVLMYNEGGNGYLMLAHTGFRGAEVRSKARSGPSKD